MNADTTRRRALLAPTVRQSPTRSAALAALQSVLQGYGLSTTAVDALAAAPAPTETHAPRSLTRMAEQVGLEAHCRFAPVEHLATPGCITLPALVWAAPDEHEAERLLVLWQRVGPWVQVMDTAQGLRWLHTATLTRYVAGAAIPITGQEWRDAAASPAYTTYWQQRLRSHGFEPQPAAERIDQAQVAPGWYPLAALDAAVRMVDQLIAGGALRPGAAARTTLEQLYTRALADGPEQQQAIPTVYWSVVPAVPAMPAPDNTSPDAAQLLFRGIWLIELAAPPATTPAETDAEPQPAAATAPRLTTPGAQTIFAFLRREGLLSFGILGAALLFASGAVVLEALLLRSAMTLGVLFPAVQQQTLLLGSLLLFVVVLLFLEWHINSTVARTGRRLDARLRMAVLEQLPGLSAHALQQHATADQMERIHASRDLHNLPEFVTRVIRTLLLLFFTLVGIAWIDPLSALPGLLIVVVTVGPFWIGRTLLDALNLDTRTHLGRLMRFYLDGMLGLVPIQVHSAERTMRRVYERYLANWIGSMLELAKAEFWIAALEQTCSHLLIALTILLFVARNGSIVELPLLLFWLFQLALLGRDLARQVFRTLNEQSKCTRFTDLLEEYTHTGPPPATSAAPPAEADPATDATPSPVAPGVAINFAGVSVQADAATILHPFDLTIAAGSHVAIVGPSGAGKSTLVGLLSGRQPAASGTITLDGQPLTPATLAALRWQTAWVDPLVQIWNRSLLYNLTYGGEHLSLPHLLDQADLRPVIAALPDGMQSLLGERGRRVSGGQGQRVRLGRAMQRPEARLVILDEPFRGLDREQRTALLDRARTYWHDTTLLCITHDVRDTGEFARVLVVEDGRIVEDGSPAELREQPASRYRALLEAEQAVRERLWAGPDVPWRTLQLENGVLQEHVSTDGATAAPTAATAIPPEPRPAAAPPHPATTEERYPLSWNSVDVDAAVRALAYATGLSVKQPAPPPPERQDTPQAQRLEPQLEVAAGRLNLEIEPLEVAYGELTALLRYAGPALIRLPDQRLLLLLGTTPWWATILAPNLQRRRVPLSRLQALICQPLDAPHMPEVEATLADLPLLPRRQAQARRVLLEARLAEETVGEIWLLQLPAGAPLRRQVRQAGLLRYLAMALGGELLSSLFYVGVFALLLMTIAEQQVVGGWMVAALLLLLMRVPAEMTRWLGEQFVAVGLRDIIKRRLFHGVLQLDPDRVKQHGTGQFLGWVMESERLEQAAQAVPFLLNTLVALGVAGLLLALGAGGLLHSLVLLLWLLLLGLIARGSLRAYLEQRTYHHQMTRDLLERMEGHQTRLVQEDPQRWHDEEDQELAHYHLLSLHDDYYRTLMAVVMPYGWLAVSLLTLLPAFLLQPDAWAQLGSSFLGILWVFQLLRASLTDLFDLIRAIGARRMLEPIEAAATGSDRPLHTRPCPAHLANRRTEAHPLLEMQQVRFAYPDQERPTLADCELHIYHGNRLLLTGPSGGGKSTLAALLAGQRVPQSGMLFLYGLDQQTLGSACWRSQVVIAPQFHENHIIEASLLFNLLLGRAWPPLPEDIAATEALCHELGLTPLIERMPRGLYEPVGTTGWQLSHGERSRVYIARALLQGAGIIILDESFGSLDPHSMQAALRCALTHARTLLVIAHP
jgi:ATP-binding cassette subfamily B protein